MRKQNVIDIPKKLIAKPIYRIEPFDRLIEILRSKRLTLVSPSKWEDPFENFILSAKIKVGQHKLAFADHDRFYGSCWTWKGYSDALWRIYSPDKQGVRLRTSIRKLG